MKRFIGRKEKRVVGGAIMTQILEMMKRRLLYFELLKNFKRERETFKNLDFQKADKYYGYFEDLFPKGHPYEIQFVYVLDENYYIVTKTNKFLPGSIDRKGIQKTLLYDQEQYKHSYRLMIAVLHGDIALFEEEVKRVGGVDYSYQEIMRGQQHRKEEAIATNRERG